LTRRDIAAQIKSLKRRIERIAELGTKFKFEAEPVVSVSDIVSLLIPGAHGFPLCKPSCKFGLSLKNC